MKSFTKSEVNFHRTLDHSDPGFTLKGYKMRWISNVVEVRRAGRIWRPLHINSLPEDAQKKFKERNPSWANGDTIRRRDLTLSYAPLAEVKEYQARNKEDQNANEAIFKGQTKDGAVTRTGSITTERMTAKDFNI